MGECDTNQGYSRGDADNPPAPRTECYEVEGYHPCCLFVETGLGRLVNGCARDVGGVRSCPKGFPYANPRASKVVGRVAVGIIVAHLDGQDGFGALEREGVLGLA